MKARMIVTLLCALMFGCENGKHTISKTPNIGTYSGMVAKPDGRGGIQMFSASSGQLLRWISFADFEAVYVNKTQPEYGK